ncbi:MAG: hypothetical protein V3S02_03705, partial [Dehalococcoidales bacterium]
IKQAGEDDEQSTSIILKQWLGRTWSRVIKMIDPGSHFEIETPTATAIVRGTLFSTEVDETGLTTVITTEGLVSVAAQGQEVFIPASQQTLVETGAEPAEPVPQNVPKSQIIIKIDMTAAGSVTDPTGASTGRLPNGITYNQIAGSQSLITIDNIQTIQIPNPVTGEYIISLRFDDPQPTHFTIQYLSDGEVISEQPGQLLPIRETDWQISINLEVEDGVIVATDFGDVEPIGDDPSENLAGITSDSDDSPSDDEDGKPDEDRGSGKDNRPDDDKDRDKNQDNGPDEDDGSTEDQGTDENKGPGENKGRDKDEGPVGGEGGSEDVGPDEDGDKGKGKGKGKNQDNGPDEDRGKGQDKKPDSDKGKGPDKSDNTNDDNDKDNDKDKDKPRKRQDTLTSS